jgi:hypothetical protein
MVDQDTETAFGVAEATGGFFGGQLLDEIGAQGFVLTMGGVSGLEKDFRRVC